MQPAKRGPPKSRCAPGALRGGPREPGSGRAMHASGPAPLRPLAPLLPSRPLAAAAAGAPSASPPPAASPPPTPLRPRLTAPRGRLRPRPGRGPRLGAQPASSGPAPGGARGPRGPQLPFLTQNSRCAPSLPGAWSRVQPAVPSLDLGGVRPSPAPCLGSNAPSPSSPLLYPPLIPLPPFIPTSAPALRPPSLAELDWPFFELSDLSPALLLGDSLARRPCQRRAHRAGGAQAATAAGSRRPESLEGPEGPERQGRKWTGEMERLRIAEAHEDRDGKDGDAVGLLTCNGQIFRQCQAASPT
nr:uncharacterized protein LOC106782012 isoform X3 [Equus caballus]